MQSGDWSEGFEIVEVGAIGIRQLEQMSGYEQLLVVRYGAQAQLFLCLMFTCFYNKINNFSKLQSSMLFPPQCFLCSVVYLNKWKMYLQNTVYK